MSPAVISITTVAYFIILFTISYIAGRKADNEGFFVGNRKSAWYIVAFAMIGIHSRTNYHCICTCSPLLSHESGFHL